MATIASASAPNVGNGSAPKKVFISYSHDSDEHGKRVLALAEQLRSNGVQSSIDQYEPNPAETWQIWMRKQIEEADYVLLVCTETYKRRFESAEEPSKGLGVIYEGSFITKAIYRGQGKNFKYIPILFSQDDE